MNEEEFKKEFLILWNYRFNQNLKEEIIKNVRGYFDRGKRANDFIKELEGGLKE